MTLGAPRVGSVNRDFQRYHERVDAASAGRQSKVRSD